MFAFSGFAGQTVDGFGRMSLGSRVFFPTYVGSYASYLPLCVSCYQDQEPYIFQGAWYNLPAC